MLNVTGLGISDIAAGYGVKLYPNPNNGSFVLEFTDNVQSDIVITDAVGRVIITSSKISKQENFNLGELSAGVYFMVINRNGEQKSLKFSVVK